MRESVEFTQSFDTLLGRNTNNEFRSTTLIPSELRNGVLLQLPEIQQERFGRPQSVHRHFCAFHAYMNHVAFFKAGESGRRNR